jgi:hypothetical protein
MIEHAVYTLIKISLAALVVESITEIITTSEVMSPFRNTIFKLAYPNPPADVQNTNKHRLFKLVNNICVWIYKLISCGYCTSVWVSMPVGVSINCNITGNMYVDVFITVFSTHRISNWIHVVYELVRKGRVNSHELFVKIENTETSET